MRKLLSGKVAQFKAWGRRNRLAIVGSIIILVAVLTIGLLILKWPQKTNWEANKQVAFVYMHQANVTTTSNQTLPGVVFELPDGTTCSVPTTDARGGKISFEDERLPKNTFVLVPRKSPPITFGQQTIQEGFDYLEVRYHVANKEPQVLVPTLRPKNRPPEKE